MEHTAVPGRACLFSQLGRDAVNNYQAGFLRECRYKSILYVTIVTRVQSISHKEYRHTKLEECHGAHSCPRQGFGRACLFSQLGRDAVNNYSKQWELNW